MKYLILMAIVYCLYHFLKGFYKKYKKLSKFCNCADSHLSVPGNISTARCVYCGKPPRNKLASVAHR